MDIFRFRNLTSATRFEHGQLINGIKTVMWIERFGSFGEFTITGYADKGLREQLPEGCYISHIRSESIMVVETHEIKKTKGERAEITITGRSFDSVIERRSNSSHITFPYTPAAGVVPLKYLGGNAGTQLSQLIENAFDISEGDDAVPQINVRYGSIPNLWTGLPSYNREGLEVSVQWLLDRQRIGILIERPNARRLAVDDADEYFEIRFQATVGDDKTSTVAPGYTFSTVIFDHEAGDIENASYLWSVKDEANAAVIFSKWYGLKIVDPTKVGLDRKIITVDATSIDSSFSTAPTGGDITDIQNAMIDLGTDAIRAKKRVALANVEIAKKNVRYQYRTNYNLGDFVLVNGEYGTREVMQVVEHVEIQDETGEYAYPTLDVPAT